VYFSSSAASSISLNYGGLILLSGILATVTLSNIGLATGSQLKIQGQGAGGWKLTAPAGTVIQYGTTATSSGGSIASSNRYDNIHVVSTSIAGTLWLVVSATTSGFTIT
jgi:hypothetical protein